LLFARIFTSVKMSKFKHHIPLAKIEGSVN
jgi:hypothetical protein